MVLKMASSRDFQNSQFWCTSSSGARLGVFEMDFARKRDGSIEERSSDLCSAARFPAVVRERKFSPKFS